MHRESKLAMSITRAATILKVSNRTICRWMKGGQLEAVRSFGGAKLVGVDSINLIIRGRTQRQEILPPEVDKLPATLQVEIVEPPALQEIRDEEPSPESPPRKVVTDEGSPPQLPPLPIDGNSSHIVRSIPGTDAVPRACTKDGGLMDRRGDYFVCMSCDNRVNVYEQQSIK